MFRIMLLLCYSLIDTNTIPFYFSTVSDRKSRATHSAVRTYRIISSVSLLILRVYTPGHVLDLRSHLVTWAVSLLLLRWSISSYKQWYRLNVVRLWDSKGSVNLLRINCVSLTNSHTRHDAFVETNPPVVLSSIRIPILDRVWYHAPWLRHCKRYRQCGQLQFGYLLW